RKRYLLAQSQIEALIAVMKDDVVSTEEHVAMLARELSTFHGDMEMGRCRSMGAVLERHLALRLELR
ncbi:MAG: hypothetical protein KA175_15255, partial [Flavobacteriales bacterium]|nr:hypothetical protein [Flavobacteriales bacterium]